MYEWMDVWMDGRTDGRMKGFAIFLYEAIDVSSQSQKISHKYATEVTK